MAVQWGEMSPADYDRALMVRGHKRAAEDQGALFYVATPTKERKAAKRDELPGQVDIFAALASEDN